MKTQRTNSPVHAHLILAPNISTKTGFVKFYFFVVGRGQQVIIYVNLDELEDIMIHAKFQNHRTFSPGDEDF